MDKKLWLLKPTNALGNPHSLYDCVSYFIIRATAEAIARQIASENAKDETPACWLEPRWSTCEEYVFPTAEGDTGIVWSESRPG